MLKVVIIDDEPNILAGLQKIIDWEKHDLTIVGTAPDGELGLEVINKCNPDLVLTDIRMNFMNGLELIRSVKRTNQQIEFIVLSAYSDFEYAKEACELGVFSYILKPIVADELLRTILLLRNKIIRERQIYDTNELFHQELPVLKERFINQLLEADIQPDDVMRKAKSLGFDFTQTSNFIVVLIQVTHSQYENKQHLLTFIKKIALESISELFPSSGVYLDNHIFGILIWSDEFSEFDIESLDGCLHNIKDTIHRLTESAVSIARGDIGKTFNNIHEINIVTNRVLKHSYLLGNNILLTSDQIKYCIIDKHIYPFDIEKILLDDIQNNHMESISSNLIKFVDWLRNHNFNHAQTIFSFNQLLMTVSKILLEMVNGEQVKNEIMEIVKSLFYQPINEIVSHINTCICKNMNQTTTAEKQYLKKIAREAIDVIQKNLFNSSLSIKLVADTIHINSAYLGQLLNRELGQSYKEFISELRVEQAKKLLCQANVKVYEIAEKVGYENSSYFNVVFKKQTGMTPIEYRDSILGIQD